MRISEVTSYPHPVLAPWSTDITGARIETRIQFGEDTDSNQVSILCETVLDQPDIVDLIAKGVASFGCFIKCQETGFRRLQRLGFPSGTHDFAPGALLGRVQIRPVVWALSSISDYNPAGASEEFGGSSNINMGQILALDDEQVIEVTRPPIAPIESIFEIVSAEDISEGSFVIDTEANRITVTVAKGTYALIQALRQTSPISRAAVMNSLYVPVVMDVLDQVRDGYEQFEEFRWVHPFRARCEIAGIDLTKLELLNDAQRLLDMPFSTLRKLTDEEEG